MIDTILFDLDGTLLKMDQEEFLKAYFNGLEEKFSKFGKDLISPVQAGVVAMLKNDGKKTNEALFWEVFNSLFVTDENVEFDFQSFYENEFQLVKTTTKVEPLAKKVIDLLNNKGYELVLCTNPLFPRIATHSRIRWGNLEVDDFSYITTFENSSFSKPNLKYYQEVLSKLDLVPSQTMMVGNDVQEDLCVKKLNIKTFLVEDNLINRGDEKIITDYRGTFADFYDFVLKLPER